MTFKEKLVVQIISFIWMSGFGLILPLLWFALELYAGEFHSDSVRETILGWLFFSFTFWNLDNFCSWAFKRQDTYQKYSTYPQDYPSWKKLVHYSTVGKYSKEF